MTDLIGVEHSVELGPGGDDILLLALKRVTDGLRLKAKSEVFEKFFATASEKCATPKARVKLFGTSVEVYNMIEASIRTKDATVEQFNDQLMVEDYIPNVSFLRAVGLKDGVAFTIPCVISIPQIESYGKAVQRAARDLYETYMRPYGENLRIYVRTEKVA